jgi:hypothetical protein
MNRCCMLWWRPTQLTNALPTVKKSPGRINALSGGLMLARWMMVLEAGMRFGFLAIVMGY